MTGNLPRLRGLSFISRLLIVRSVRRTGPRRMPLELRCIRRSGPALGLSSSLYRLNLPIAGDI